MPTVKETQYVNVTAAAKQIVKSKTEVNAKLQEVLNQLQNDTRPDLVEIKSNLEQIKATLGL